MDGPRYDTDVDLSNRNNSHTLMVELVGGTKRVLDVGCATGYLAEALVERGCTVSGVESDPVAAEEARPHLERLVVGDIETMDLTEAFGADRFDAIVRKSTLSQLDAGAKKIPPPCPPALLPLIVSLSKLSSSDAR